MIVLTSLLLAAIGFALAAGGAWLMSLVEVPSISLPGFYFWAQRFWWSGAKASLTSFMRRSSCSRSSGRSGEVGFDCGSLDPGAESLFWSGCGC